jgi:hypothetical protein
MVGTRPEGQKFPRTAIHPADPPIAVIPDRYPRPPDMRSRFATVRGRGARDLYHRP